MPQQGHAKAFQHVVPVILSGGRGSRLWPLSRQSYPKQLWPLLSEKTLLQESALRSQKLGLTAPIVVCNEEYRFIIAEQLRDVGINNARIVLEPLARGSASASVAAAALIAEEYPDALMWIMTADAAIQDQEALGDALKYAVEAAKLKRIVTFGIQPTHAETGYGYIERGVLLAGCDKSYEVAQFVEKPTLDKAQELLKNKRYCWNSGMFITSATLLLEEAEKFEPEMMRAVDQSVLKRKSDLDFIRLDYDNFAKSPDISIDYAIIERTKKAAVVPASFGWSDVGSWDALWDLGDKDESGNVSHGDVMCEQAHNCYIHSEEGHLTTAIGVDDLIIVTTRDAVMVTRRGEASNLKKVVSRLYENGHSTTEVHNRIYRPWGFYDSLTQGNRFQVKKIMVKPGQLLSLQKHFHRAEHWVVVEGTALVTCDDTKQLVRENEGVYLPMGAVHRLENPGRIPLTLIEVQSGAYLGEDDIVRLDDVYRRE